MAVRNLPPGPSTLPANDDARVPPHDLDAQTTILGNILREGARLDDAAALRPEDFYPDGDSRVFAACLGLRVLGRDVGAIAVRDYLDAADRLGQIGGKEHIARLIENAPYVSPRQFAECVRIVLEKSRLRRLVLACQRLEAQGYAGAVDFEGARAELTSLFDVSRGIRAAVAPSEIVERWRTEPALVRVPTGFPTLDEASRGGFTVPRRVYILGAPGAGKTALAIFLAHRYARQGPFLVGIHAVDEEDEDDCVRLAQCEGFTIAQCESRDARVLDDIEAALRRLPIRFYDGSWSIEEATADLARAARQAGAIPVYVGDSLHTLTSRGAHAAETKREIVEANVAAIREATKTHRLLSIITAEVNRRSYQDEDAAERSDDMAAGAESRTIEFSAQTQLMLRTPKGYPDVVRVSVPKNRRGRSRFDFFLRLDRDRHELTECPEPSTDPTVADRRESATRATNKAGVERDARIVAAIVAERPGIPETGSDGLRAAVKSAGHKWGVERLDAARALLRAGLDGWRLVDRGEGKATSPRRWHLERLPAPHQTEGS
jgi:replicative DNA helicase